MSNFHTLLLALALLGPANTNADHWGYSGTEDPAHWADYFPTCGGHRQSPINIVTENVVYNDSLAAFTLTNFDNNNKSLHWSFTNNGHSVVVNVDAGEMRVTGGGLDGPYRVAQYHFHWGNVSTQGSEHTLDGQRYPMELHIVSYKMAYGSIANAGNYSDGLAVLGFFLEASDTNNSIFANLVSLVPNITKETEIVHDLTIFDLSALLPADISKYYRYLGSLTTPPCSEIVVWTVFQTTIKVSEAQLAEFRKVTAGQNETYFLSNNFRPAQPLYDRQVTASFETPMEDTTQAETTTKKSSSSTNGLVFSSALLLLSQLLSAFSRP